MSKKNKLLFSLFFLFSSSLLVLLFFVFNYLNYKNTAIKKSKSNVIKETQNAVKRINDTFNSFIKVADNLAADITRGKLKDKKILAALNNAIKTNENIWGIAVAYKPYAYKKNIRLYAPYFTRKDGVIKLVQVEKVYDYTLSKYRWYIDTMKKGASWHEPYFGKAGKL